MSSMTAVIKLTKLCNLRCNYCYEFPHLADPQKVSLEQLKAILCFLADIEKKQNTKVRICWHGGEPTLVGEKYFAKASKLIKEVFGGHRTQTIQTNLFRLRRQEFEIFEEVDHVSVSFDAFGLDRVSISGSNSGETVLKNMDTLRTNGIEFGAINVLTKQNLSSLEKIYNFYNETGIPVRILPFYRTSSDAQSQTFGLTPSEVRQAFLTLIKLHMTKGKFDRIVPVSDFVRMAITSRLETRRPLKYDKEASERVLVFDTNGDVYADGTAYNGRFLYGNVYKDCTQDILNSEGRRLAIERSKRLMSMACEKCEYWGVCSGIEVGEQTDLEKDSEEKCPVWRACISYCHLWLEEVPEATAVFLKALDTDKSGSQEEECFETDYDAP